MSTLLQDAYAVEVGGSQPWPQNARLFQPYETDQILLPDFASCLSVKTFLKMSALPYKIELRSNAEAMSPSGRVPFLHTGNLLVAELDPIINVVKAKGVSLSEWMSEEERADMKAYSIMVERVLHQAELYLQWCDPEVMSEVTKLRYGSPYPWPLNVLLPWKRQREVKRQLTASGWNRKTPQQVKDEVSYCCGALSEKLGSQKFFFGDKPCELDALVFGHLYAILTTPLPVNVLAEAVKEFNNLQNFVQQIDEQYFRDFQLGDS